MVRLYLKEALIIASTRLTTRYFSLKCTSFTTFPVSCRSGSFLLKNGETGLSFSAFAENSIVEISILHAAT